MPEPITDVYKLDNPAWYALAETHASFAVGDNDLKRYQSSVVAFAACRSFDKVTQQHLDRLIDPSGQVFFIGGLPTLPGGYVVESVLPCAQMICTKPISNSITHTIEPLHETDEEQLFSLINQVQPGYYLRHTRLMGDYFGIRQEGKLVAVTGERMRLDAFTEISAVVTHPGFTGRQYAQQLITHTVNKNIAAGIIPFLHVAASNERAIRLYEYLGFVHRRTITFTRIRRN